MVEKQEVVDRLARTFAEVSHPGWQAVLAGNDTPCHRSDLEQVASEVSDTHAWSDVPPDQLQQYAFTLLFQSGVAFTYYLAAYMWVALHEDNPAGFMDLEFFLTNARDEGWERLLLSALSEEQYETVAMFVAYVVHSEDYCFTEKLAAAWDL